MLKSSALEPKVPFHSVLYRLGQFHYSENRDWCGQLLVRVIPCKRQTRRQNQEGAITSLMGDKDYCRGGILRSINIHSAGSLQTSVIIQNAISGFLMPTTSERDLAETV